MQSGSGFGNYVSPAGDVNGDGYDDVLVGANGYDIGLPEGDGNGRVYAYFGSATGLRTTPSWFADFQGEATHVWGNAIPLSIAAAGDLNGDGFDDIAVGTSTFESMHDREGAVWVYYGSASGLPADADWFVESDRA